MESSGFSSLPTELVLSVAEFLPIRNVACLSLTCKALYYNDVLRKTWTLGFDPNVQHCDCKHGSTSCCPGLDIKNHEPLLFLQLLEKDLPRETRCDHCQRLHPHRETEKLEYGFWEWLGDSCPRSWSGMWLRFDAWCFALRFEDVQKVMKRYNWGESYGDTLDSIGISTGWQVKKYRSWGYNTDWTGKFDVEPRIIHGNLMLRTCQRMLIDRDQISVSRLEQLRDIVARKSTVCHAGCESSEVDLRQQVEKSMGRLRSQRVDQRSLSNDIEIIRCGSCLTEFAFAVQDLGEVGIEFVLNTWVNLGTCRNTYSPAWLGAAWHDHDIYSLESVSKAQNTAMLESGYVSTHDRSWVNPAHYISAVEYLTPTAIYNMHVSTWPTYVIQYGRDGTWSIGERLDNRSGTHSISKAPSCVNNTIERHDDETLPRRTSVENRDPDWQDIIQKWKSRYTDGISSAYDIEGIPSAPAEPRTGYLGTCGTFALCEDIEKYGHPESRDTAGEESHGWLAIVAAQNLGLTQAQTQTAETGVLSSVGVQKTVELSQTAGELSQRSGIPLGKRRWSRLWSGMVALYKTSLKSFTKN